MKPLQFGAALLSLSTMGLTQSFQPPGVPIPHGYDTCAVVADSMACPLDLFAALQRLDVARMRRHAWNVFAGLTRTDQVSTLPIFLTWYRKCDFEVGTPCQYDDAPTQFKDAGLVKPGEKPGLDAAMNFYNYAFVKFVIDHRLCDSRTLSTIQRDAKGKQIEDSHIDAFPPDAIAVKTGWVFIKSAGRTLVPVWDPEANSLTEPNGNLAITPAVDMTQAGNRWSRYVAVDPAAAPGTGGTYDDASGLIPQRVRIVPLSSFYTVPITEANVSVLPERLRSVSRSNGKVSGYLALVALHFTTKEIPNWVWASFWWHDRPAAGPYGFDRPGLVLGPWTNYLMTVSYSMNEPREPDGSSHIAFNPWLEGPFPGGVQSNCMSCHRRAAWPPLKGAGANTRRGEVSVADVDAFPSDKNGPRVKTDFVWTIANFGEDKRCQPLPHH